MNRERAQAIALCAVGLVFLALAFTRSQSRAVWVAVAAGFVLIGVRRLRRRQPPSGTPGA
jgi:O-antigen ligase